MPKVKLGWRFRKKSESNPIETLECGCKRYVYDGTIVRYCEKHNPVGCQHPGTKCDDCLERIGCPVRSDLPEASNGTD